jgi:hypothetical protein
LDGNETPRRRRRSTTPEGRERQVIAAAYDLAEEQIREGKASAMVITHFLKLGTERERLERERLEQENELTKAKIQNLRRQENIEELYGNAIAAMQLYSGRGEDVEYLD